MTLPTWLWIAKTYSHDRHAVSKRSQPAAHKMAALKLALEPLEDRLTPSGFGSADGSYIEEPRPGGLYLDVKIQPTNQAILAAGASGTLPDGTSSGFGVERYDSLGNVDTAYGDAGLATPSLGPLQNAQSLAIQANGKAVVAGDVYFSGSGSYGVGIARLNLDGTPDASFGNAGWTGLQVPPANGSSVALQSTGKMVVAGESSSSNVSGVTESALVARFNANGSIDSGTSGFGQLVGNGKNATPTGYALTSFGVQEQGYSDLVVQSDDKVVTVGTLFMPDGTDRLVVARYTASGALDKTFNSRGYDIPALTGISSLSGYSVALQTDGKIVVVGNSSGVDGSEDMLVTRFNIGGTLDTAFGGGKGYVRLDVDGTATQTQEAARGVAIQPDGKIVVAGFEMLNGSGGDGGSVMVARLNPTGTLDAGFGAGGIKLGSPPAGTGYHMFIGRAVALQADGSIIVAGEDHWANSGASQHPLLMRFFGTTAPLAPLRSAAVLSQFSLNSKLDLGVSPATQPATAPLAPGLDSHALAWSQSSIPHQQAVNAAALARVNRTTSHLVTDQIFYGSELFSGLPGSDVFGISAS